MFKRVAITISLVIALLVSTTGGLAQGSAPQPTETPELAEHIPGELLISFNPGVKSAQAVQRMQELGLEHVKEIRPLKVHLVKLPPGLSVEKALERFSHLPGLAFAEPNYIYQITATTQAEISDQWGLGQINAEQAWGELSELERNPILLATVDTGIDRGHPDLSTNIWINENEIQGNLIDDDLNGFVDDYWGWDFVNSDNDPDDDNMHGTGVSSVMAGVQDGAGVAGVCPWCQVMAVKTLGSNGSGALDVVAEGVNYAAQMGAKVINLSLTGPHGATLEAAVNNAWSLGVVVVAAAGNNGLNTIMYPSGYANAMGVASTDESDYHSCFSNHAENSISVSAPGERILIALPNQGYGIYSGTSLSAPHVAGLAGLLFSQDETGTRTNSQVRTQIETSAEDLGPKGVDAAFGHGRIDAYRALGYGPPSGIPEDGVYSISDTASGYAHARKLVRDASGTLHMVWHTKEGSDYQIKYAYSEDDGTTWTLNTGLSDVIYASENETYHPALATDGEYLFVAFPSRTGPDTNYPYEILFTRKSLNEDLWEATQSLMGGTVNAVRPDIYFDPTDGGRLHVIASSLDDAPYLYYTGSDAQGATDTWDAVNQFNPSNSTPNTRYAAIYANGDNIYVATKTMDQVCIWILCFTYFYLHTTRSIDGGVNWIDQTQISSYQALTTSEYGVSLAGVGDRVYMGYEVGSNIYFRRYDGAGWSDFEPLDTEDPNILYKWPSITQAEDGQAWMMYELDKELYMRHYDGSNWEAEESLGKGTYANLKLGTQGDQLEWLYTSCNGSPFDLVYGSRSLSSNNPPVADDQLVNTDEDTEVSITLTANDLDGDPLTYDVVSGPTNGSLSGTGPGQIYTPDLNYNGTDSFTFVADDGTTNSNTATVSITVTAVNDPPVADDQAANTDEDTPLAITLTGSDVDGDDLTYSVVSDPANGTLSGTAPNLTYTPSPGYNGVDSFTFKVNDGTVDSNIAIVDITVTAVNNPPVADDQGVITPEDTPVGIILTANDQDGESLTYSIVSGPAKGTLSGTAPDLTYTPGANYNGADSFTIVANDGIEDSNLATVDITVTAVNDSPVANPQAVTTDEDTAAGIILTADDVDVDSLTYSVVAGPANGILDGTAPGLTYTPSPDYNGSDSFTFKVNDGTVDSNIATVDITVNSVNDAPVADEQAVTTDEDSGVAITLAGSDVDGDDLTYSVLTFPAKGSLSGTMPDLTYTPIPNFNGSDSFNFNVADGDGGNDTATVTITVTTVNDSPVANPQAVATDEDTGVSITLTGSDIDGGSLTYSVVTGTSNGSLSGTAPSLTYTPIANYNGADSFTFLANDGLADSNTATVTISVNPVNDSPVAYSQGVTTAEDSEVSITLTASDLDGDPLTYIVVSDPAYGTLSGTAPNLTYTPDPEFNGADSFTFKANDGSVDSNTATVDITVTAAPAVVDAVANGEIFVAGTVSGDYTYTFEDDGAREAITERDSGGKPIRRYSYLEHKWTFEVIPGNAVTLYANAWSSGSSDGDSFIFAYSTDDASYTDMFTVANNLDSGYESYGLPASIQGTVYVRVSDSDHTAENRAQDTVFVDHLYIRSETEAGDPPNAPTDLGAMSVSATQIDLAWSHISTDEMGFKIERHLDGSNWSEIASVGAGVSSYSDTDVTPNTTYDYRVQAYNGSGTSGYSNMASATTGDGMSLTASGFKVKGVHVVDLEWAGSNATSFDIYRDGVGVALGVPGYYYSDNTKNKGGAIYQYQICEAGSQTNCSNTVRVEY